MPLPRRIAAGLLIAALAAASLVALAAMPAGAQEAPKGRKVATLKIITPNASVQRAGKTEFKPATDGQKLRVGDTVQTDATGFVEIQYADDSFTRLDVNTTLVIESLTDEEGNRKIKTNVESGQTWNRVEALTENESFEQEGAGATAAVTGTAFAYQCSIVDGTAVCTLTTVVDGVTYTTVDGELKVLDPLLQCTATEIDESNSDLCAVPTELTQAALIANQWLMQNLYLDGLLGYEGPVFGVIVLQDGEVVEVTPPQSGESLPPATPPIINDDAPIACYPDCTNAYNVDALPDGFTPGTGIQTHDDYGYVDFVANLSFIPEGTVFIVFTKLPDLVGTVHIFTSGCGNEVMTGCADEIVVTGQQYGIDTVFTFVPNDVGLPNDGCGFCLSDGAETQDLPTQYSDTIEYTAVGGGGEDSSEEIDVTVEDACAAHGECGEFGE